MNEDKIKKIVRIFSLFCLFFLIFNLFYSRFYLPSVPFKNNFWLGKVQPALAWIYYLVFFWVILGVYLLKNSHRKFLLIKAYFGVGISGLIEIFAFFYSRKLYLYDALGILTPFLGHLFLDLSVIFILGKEPVKAVFQEDSLSGVKFLNRILAVFLLFLGILNFNVIIKERIAKIAYKEGIVYYKEKDYENALPYFSKAAIIGRGVWIVDASYVVGECYLNCNEYVKAIFYLKRALDFLTRKYLFMFEPEWKIKRLLHTHYMLAYAYFCLDDLENSIIHSEKVLEFDPGNDSMKKRLEIIKKMKVS